MGVARMLLGLVVFGLAGCVLDATAEPVLPCDRTACSDNGYCELGECFCDADYVGDPYALHGCQAVHPGSPCETTCGLNAYCDESASVCRCADGFASVCGTGDCIEQDALCDDTEDCENGNDEDPTVCFPAVVQEYLVVDACDDSRDVEWRLWATERNWVWPSIDSAFVTPGLELEDAELIECLEGEEICFGAASDGRDWGVGLEGYASCEGCCFTCEYSVVDLGFLDCD